MLIAVMAAAMYEQEPGETREKAMQRAVKNAKDLCIIVAAET